MVIRARVLLFVIIATLLAIYCSGCKPAPGSPDSAAATSEVKELLAEISDKLDRPAPDNSATIDRLTETFDRNFHKLHSSIGKLDHRGPAGDRRRQETSGWTGCIVDLDAYEGRCPPCADVKHDFAVLQEEMKNSWKIGTGDDVHFKLMYHQERDFPLPRFRYYRDGKLEHTIEGYPRFEYRGSILASAYKAGCWGPIHRIINSHPCVDRDAAKRAMKARAEQSIERLGSYNENHNQQSQAYSYSTVVWPTVWYSSSARSNCAGGICY